MLKKRNFLKLLDFSQEEIAYLLKLSRELKEGKKKGTESRNLQGKNIALIFEKDSTRTRCAFEVGARDQGATTTYLGPTGSQVGKKESVRDTARVLGRMYDGIQFRGYSQEAVEILGEYAGVPVWNGLTDEYHPTQVLADFLTIEEELGSLTGKKLVYMGDGRNNMSNSLMIGCAIMGMDYTVISPEGLQPEEELYKKVLEISRESGSQVRITSDICEAAGADAVYTDVWVSMGEDEGVWGERIEKLMPYQVTKEVMKSTGKDSIFMHCLPSFHNLETEVGEEIYRRFGISEMEVTDEVFEGTRSKVFDQAENRLHTIKAIMVATMGGR